MPSSIVEQNPYDRALADLIIETMKRGTSPEAIKHLFSLALALYASMNVKNDQVDNLKNKIELYIEQQGTPPVYLVYEFAGKILGLSQVKYTIR